MQMTQSKFVPYLLIKIEEQYKFSNLKIKRGCVKFFMAREASREKFEPKRNFKT